MCAAKTPPAQSGQTTKPTSLSSSLLIVTDLDGSLLDHYTYSFEPALELLTSLKNQGTPVVLCSSKTRAEMQELRGQLGLASPYIVENGAAVYLPKALFPTPPAGATDAGDEWCMAFGDRRDHWLGLLDQMPATLRASYRCFSELTVGQLADLTGLSPEAALLAAEREFGEPLHWRGDDVQKSELITRLESAGARVLEGGRFLHIVGNWNKGRALVWLADEYARGAGLRPTTVAIGDSHNDVAMLEAADYAVVIRSPVHTPPVLKRSTGVILTGQTGPRGWAEGVGQVLGTLGQA